MFDNAKPKNDPFFSFRLFICSATRRKSRPKNVVATPSSARPAFPPGGPELCRGARRRRRRKGGAKRENSGVQTEPNGVV